MRLGDQEFKDYEKGYNDATATWGETEEPVDFEGFFDHPTYELMKIWWDPEFIKLPKFRQYSYWRGYVKKISDLRIEQLLNYSH